MDIQRIQELVEKFIENRATPAEEAELMNWYQSANETELEWLDYSEATRLRMLSEISKRTQPVPVRRLWPRIAAAASVLLILSTGGFFLLRKKHPVQQVSQNQIHDIKPGGNKAILTLAGGKQIMLNAAKIGVIAQQGITAINKTASGQIVYNAAPAGQATESIMNTITTPRGGKWFVALSDGTKVWLNAASSITYPTAFTGNDRRVSITGEAYFEVAHNAAKKFIVVSNGQAIEDIGTSFDINAYGDEPAIRTTLVEGSVKVSTDNNMVVLKPGQQAQVKTGAAITIVTDKDMERTLAWKNGLFIFNRTDLYTLMRELSRWYDVDVIYEDGVKDDVFYGKIKQDNNLSEILKVLELGDVHFRIDGKKLIVLP